MNKNITAAEKRFLVYLTEAATIMAESKKKKNPAVWIFSTDLRTVMFRLQGLARLYKKMHDKKLFEHILEKTKVLEDALGKVDYFAAFEKQFKRQKGFPVKLLAYCSTEKQNAYDALQKVLTTDGWIDGNTIEDWKNKLSKAAWLSPEKDAAAIEKRYGKAIEKIKEFVAATNFSFTDIELHVHELRRKTRWLSIYAAALQGGVQLKANKEKRAVLKKYLTPEIVQSPFNKLAKKPNNVVPVYCNKDEFFALSWFIASLGNIKDQGLAEHFLQEAIKTIEKKDATAASKRASAILGKKHVPISALLEQSSAITKSFFEDSVLDNLLVK